MTNLLNFITFFNRFIKFCSSASAALSEQSQMRQNVERAPRDPTRTAQRLLIIVSRERALNPLGQKESVIRGRFQIDLIQKRRRDAVDLRGALLFVLAVTVKRTVFVYVQKNDANAEIRLRQKFFESV